MSKAENLREKLVTVSLEWQDYFGVAPSITAAISELDAAKIVGMKEDEYCAGGVGRTAVTKDFDFKHNGLSYQITSNRPSGNKGSLVTKVSQKTEKKRRFGWDVLIWILYDRAYNMQEAWQFTADEYRKEFATAVRLSPDHMRRGRCLFRLGK
jgi:hypothetical protein